MKKIGIAVFSLMFIAVAYVSAQDVQFSFDGENAVKNSQAMEKFSMPEAFADIEYNIPAPKRVVKFEAKKPENKTEELTIRVKKASDQKMVKNLLKKHFSIEPNYDKHILDLLKYSNTEILFNKTIVYVKVIDNNITLYKIRNKELANTLQIIDKNLQTKQYYTFATEVYKYFR